MQSTDCLIDRYLDSNILAARSSHISIACRIILKLAGAPPSCSGVSKKAKCTGLWEGAWASASEKLLLSFPSSSAPSILRFLFLPLEGLWGSSSSALSRSAPPVPLCVGDGRSSSYEAEDMR